MTFVPRILVLAANSDGVVPTGNVPGTSFPVALDALPYIEQEAAYNGCVQFVRSDGGAIIYSSPSLGPSGASIPTTFGVISGVATGDDAEAYLSGSPVYLWMLAQPQFDDPATGDYLTFYDANLSSLGGLSSAYYCSYRIVSLGIPSAVPQIGSPMIRGVA